MTKTQLEQAEVSVRQVVVVVADLQQVAVVHLPVLVSYSFPKKGQKVGWASISLFFLKFEMIIFALL